MNAGQNHCAVCATKPIQFNTSSDMLEYICVACALSSLEINEVEVKGQSGCAF